MQDDFCGYRLVKLLSDSGTIRSWEARSPTDGQRCFLKTCPDAVLSTRPEIGRVLRQSIALQRLLRRGPFLTAKRVVDGGEGLALEYQWLDVEMHAGLDMVQSLEELLTYFTSLCVAVDLLHALGLVHGDLKLANCLSSQLPNGSRTLLADLDFLSTAGARPLSTLTGTPEYLAPEIGRNDIILAASDCYSLGKSLCQLLARLAAAKHDGDKGQRLQELARTLTATEPGERPACLISAIRKVGLVDSEQEQSLLRQVLGHLLYIRLANGGSRLVSRRSIRQFLIDKCQIVGVPLELSALVSMGRKHDRLAVRQVTEALLKAAHIERAGHYWVVSLNDSAKVAAYQTLIPLAGHGWPCANRSDQSAAEFQELRKRGFAEAAYLGLRDSRSTQLNANGSSVSEELCTVLADWSRDLGRMKEACVWYAKIAGLDSATDMTRARALLEQAMLCVKMGDLDGAEGLLNDCRRMTTQLSDCQEVLWRRIDGWVKSQRGDHSGGTEQLHKALLHCDRGNLHQERMLTLYALAVLTWRQGDLTKAEQELKKAYQVCVTHRLQVQALPITSTLALLCAERAQYHTAVQWGLRTIRLATRARQDTQLPPVYLALALAYARLSQLARASACLGGYLATINFAIGPTHFLAYYQLKTFLSMLLGDLPAAEDAYRCAIALGGEDYSKILSKAHCMASEISLYRGDEEQLREYSGRGLAVATRTGDETSQREIELLLHVDNVIHGRAHDVNPLLGLSEQLFVSGALHASSTGVLYALVAAEQNFALPDWVLNLPANPDYNDKRVTIFSAVTRLITFVRRGGDLSALQASNEWKMVFMTLREGHQPLVALLVARRIGRTYISGGQRKHGQKFLEHALSIARELRNSRLERELAEEITQAGPGGTNAQEQSALLSMAASVIADVSAFDRTAERLLHIAVDCTGAERGVLLLRSLHHARLSIVAHVNCDDPSLEDIVQLSMRTVMIAYVAEKPFVTANACRDDRTRDFPSIISHNIRAAAAVPMIVNGQAIGAIYLDHHVLPTLFSDDDLRVIQAIANLAGAALRASSEYQVLRRAAETTQGKGNAESREDTFVTEDKQLLAMLSELRTAAFSDAPILITGESGTGKDILARYVHVNSPRRTGPFVVVNCAAIAPTMVESELFGIVKGAATGVHAREGRFAAADGGTLFLDEIGDMPLELQAKVLRVIENQEFEPVGSNRTTHTDVRFVCATNKDLRQLQSVKQFRSDLYYRINTFSVHLPPLRERRREIPLLVDHFVATLPRKDSRPPRFSSQALGALCRYSWPGNVRELRNVVERCCILHGGKEVSPRELPREISAVLGEDQLGPIAESDLEAMRLRELLERANGNISGAARLAKVPLTTFRRLLAKHNIRFSG